MANVRTDGGRTVTVRTGTAERYRRTGVGTAVVLVLLAVIAERVQRVMVLATGGRMLLADAKRSGRRQLFPAVRQSGAAQ